MRSRWCCLLALAGCGRVGFDASGSATVDGAAPRAWGPPVPLPAVVQSTAQDWEPALRPDGITLVFASNRASGVAELFMTQRQGASWSAPVAIAALNTPGVADTNGPCWNADGSRLYFTSVRSGKSLVYVSEVTAGPTFGPPSIPPGLETVPGIAPTVRGDELELLFTTASPTTSDILRTTRSDTASPWGPVTTVDELSTSAFDGWPGFTSDGLTVYLESNRDTAKADIYTATRPSLDAPFGTPTPVAAVNVATASDGDPQPSPDGTLLFFHSDRDSPGNTELYISSLE